MMDFVFNMMDFVFIMVNYVLKMMIFSNSDPLVNMMWGFMTDFKLEMTDFLRNIMVTHANRHDFDRAGQGLGDAPGD